MVATDVLKQLHNVNRYQTNIRKYAYSSEKRGWQLKTTQTGKALQTTSKLVLKKVWVIKIKNYHKAWFEETCSKIIRRTSAG